MIKINSGFMFIELLLVVVIIIWLAFKVTGAYFNHPSINPQAQKIIAEQGIDTTSYKSTIASTKDQVEDIQNKHFEELNKLE